VSGEEVAVLKVQRVIPTVFTFTFYLHLISLESGEIPGQNTGTNLFVGWSDPRVTLAREPCAKVGSLQPNTVPLRGQTDCLAVRNCFSFGQLLERQVNARVTDWVICVFHAPVTFPPRKCN